MKANELMIGDYVLYDGLILEVGGLTDYDIKIDLLKGDELYAQFWDEDTNNIQGIPITPEILEKNGFEDMGFYSECKVGDWRVLCDTKNVAILHREHFNIDTPVEYVHELQHALRLCGIDKEIVI